METIGIPIPPELDLSKMSDKELIKSPNVRARLPLGQYAYHLGMLFALLSFIIGLAGVGTFGFWVYVVLGSMVGSSPFNPYLDVLGLAFALLLSAGVCYFMYEEDPEVNTIQTSISQRFQTSP